MISLTTYKILHFLGLLMVFASLGARIMTSATAAVLDAGLRKWLGFIHGVGLLVIFVTGFGMIARLQIQMPWPLWIVGDLLVWVFLAFLPVVIRKNPFYDKLMWLLIFTIGFLGIALSVLKP